MFSNSYLKTFSGLAAELLFIHFILRIIFPPSGFFWHGVWYVFSLLGGSSDILKCLSYEQLISHLL